MMRLLVTGSRDWTHLDSIDHVLAYYTRQAHSKHARLTVVHGKAARGGDDLAAAWVKTRSRTGWPVAQEAHPAYWSAPCTPECRPGHRQVRDGREWCPFAGHRRNQEMVDLGARVCVAFWRNGSSGTRDCIRRAELAHIPTLKITWQERELVTEAWLAEYAPELVAW